MKSNNSIKILLSYVGASILLNVIIVLYYVLFQPVQNFSAKQSAMINLVFYIVILGITLYFGLGYLKRQIISYKKEWKKNTIFLGIGVGSLFGASITVGLLYQLINFTEQANNQEQWELIVASGTFGMISTVFISMFIAPFVEELVFRYGGFGLVSRFHVPQKAFPYLAIGVSSILFGLIHIVGDNLLQVLFYSALGAVLGFFYYKTKNIFVPMGIHFVWNTIGVIAMIVS